MVIRMSAENLPGSDQVEFRVFIDKGRAADFAGDLGDLATYYSGTVITPQEKEQPAPTPQPEAEKPDLPFRKDMTTAIYEENSGEQVAIVTREDFKRFGMSCNKYDGTLLSQVFNTIQRYANSSSQTQSGRPKVSYWAKGAWVEPADPSGPPRSTQTDGILVSAAEDLVYRLTSNQEKIPGFAQRSKELVTHFVTELFTPEDPDANKHIATIRP